MKIHEFNLTPYPRKLWVIKKWTEKELKEAFCRYDGGEVDWDLDDNENLIEAKVISKVQFKESEYLGIVVLLKPNVKNKILAHESGHIALSLFDEIDSYANPNDQEPFCYLLGYIYDCLEQVKRNKFRHLYTKRHLAFINANVAKTKLHLKNSINPTDGASEIGR
jgi:hypothetical protein